MRIATRHSQGRLSVGMWVGLLLGLMLAGCQKSEEVAAPPPMAASAPAASAAASAPTEAGAPPSPVAASPDAHHGPTRAPASADSPGPTVDPGQAADQALAKLEKAAVAFKAPTNMHQGDQAMVELRLSLGKAVAQLEGELRGAPSDHVEGAGVRVSRRVEALLTAPKSDFEITPISATEQLLGSDDDVSWRWDIKALDGGTKYLHLTLNSIVTVEGATTRKTVRSFDEQIEVKVSWPGRAEDFVAKNWQWLWATLLVPLAGWAWRRLRPDTRGSQT
jgi:hypothetical protein